MAAEDAQLDSWIARATAGHMPALGTIALIDQVPPLTQITAQGAMCRLFARQAAEFTFRGLRCRAHWHGDVSEGAAES